MGEALLEVWHPGHADMARYSKRGQGFGFHTGYVAYIRGSDGIGGHIDASIHIRQEYNCQDFDPGVPARMAVACSAITTDIV